jgi:hypothetical protein
MDRINRGINAWFWFWNFGHITFNYEISDEFTFYFPVFPYIGTFKEVTQIATFDSSHSYQLNTTLNKFLVIDPVSI